MIDQTAEVADNAIPSEEAPVMPANDAIATPPQPKRAQWAIWTGIGFFIFSCLSYLSLLLLLVLHVSAATKAVLFGVFVGCGEGAFWVSAAFVGTAMVRRYRKYLNPRNWRRSSATSPAK